MTSRTICLVFITVVTAIVSPITPLPIRYTPVVGFTLPPSLYTFSGLTVPLFLFIGAVPTVIVVVTMPGGGDTFSIVTGKLVGVACSVTTDGGVFLTIVPAVIVPITHPALGDTLVVATLELEVLTLSVLTVLLVRVISTVVVEVTHTEGVRTVLVLALELARSTVIGRTVFRLIRVIQTVLFSVTFPDFRDAPIVCDSTPELASAAVSYTSFQIHTQQKVIWAVTGVVLTPRSNQTQVRASPIVVPTWINTFGLL